MWSTAYLTNVLKRYIIILEFNQAPKAIKDGNVARVEFFICKPMSFKDFYIKKQKPYFPLKQRSVGFVVFGRFSIFYYFLCFVKYFLKDHKDCLEGYQNQTISIRQLCPFLLCQGCQQSLLS